MTFHDLARAIANMDAMAKHWTIKTENSALRSRRYSCCLWAKGKRVTAYARTPLGAVEAAMEKIRGVFELKIVK